MYFEGKIVEFERFQFQMKKLFGFNSKTVRFLLHINHAALLESQFIFTKPAYLTRGLKEHNNARLPSACFKIIFSFKAHDT